MDEQARRDLEMVRRLMAEARGAETAHGPHLVLWGVLMGSALLLTWAAASGLAVPHPGWTWVVALVIGWTGSIALGMRGERGRGRTTMGGRILAGIWIGAGVTLTLIGLAGLFAEAVPSQLLPGLTSIVLGSAFWATSWVTGRASERWLAGAWWAGGTAMLIWSQGPWTLLFQAVLVLLFEVVPGVVLLRAARSEERAPPVPALP